MRERRNKEELEWKIMSFFKAAIPAPRSTNLSVTQETNDTVLELGTENDSVPELRTQNAMQLKSFAQIH